MFLTENFNVLIELTKAALFNRSTIYPPMTNVKKNANVLKIELRRPAKGDNFYEISASFVGPWRKRIDIPVLLWHTFNGVEDKVQDMCTICQQLNMTFVTVFSYQLRPKPLIRYCSPQFFSDAEEWRVDLNNSLSHEGEPSEALIEIVFKSYSSENLDVILAKNFENFLCKTHFMFYDLSFEFSFNGHIFHRTGNINLPFHWSTPRRLKTFFRYKFGEEANIATAWVAQNDDEDSLQPFDATAVMYSAAGDGSCLPVWVLGLLGIPVPSFSTTLLTQLVCQAAELPLDNLLEPSIPLAGLPLPDICLKLPPQHALAKQNHYLVLVLTLPIKHCKFSKATEFFKNFDAITAKNWEPITEVVKDVLRASQAKHNDVTNCGEGEEEMEKFLVNYLEHRHKKPKPKKNRVYLHLPNNVRQSMKQAQDQKIKDKAVNNEGNFSQNVSSDDSMNVTACSQIEESEASLSQPDAKKPKRDGLNLINQPDATYKDDPTDSHFSFKDLTLKQ